MQGSDAIGPFAASGQRAGKEGPTNPPRTEIVDKLFSSCTFCPVRACRVGVPHRNLSYGLAINLLSNLAGTVRDGECDQCWPGNRLDVGPDLTPHYACE
ncbi:hypothetical protein D3C77_89690 [compost metagenome]